MAEDLALDTKAEAGKTPERAVRRWLMEIKLADKREKDWRKEARELLTTYRGNTTKRNNFNILWSNTEVLRPALYNSTPKPDVRRRFRQKDILGKAVSEVLERGLSYCVDAYDLDNCVQGDVLDSLLPGRAVSRVRYIPKYKGAAPAAMPEQKEAAETPHKDEAFEGHTEEVEYEQALCEHVQWDDFLHGPGKVWEEVPWVGFRQRLTKDDLIGMFGEKVAKEIRLDDVADEDINSPHNDDLKEVFKRAELWEIWDRDSGKVFFVNESYKKDLLYPKPVAEGDKPGEPPLRMKGFFPCPRPLSMVEDTGSLVPIPLYELYRKQAQELDNISGRINKIINACRVRFVHDSTLTELKALMDADDNVGIPAESARSWMANGGIDRAIWWMPVDQIAKVLNELYQAREGCKQVIYEITGLSDILRGATDPNETLGAQKMKANSASLRLQRMQREVQRYVRDLIRLLGEVIGEHFSYETLAKMTGMNFPTNQQKQEGALQLKAVQSMVQQGQQPPPQIGPMTQQLQQMLALPSWEDIMAVLKSDMSREYRIDIETDSTVAESLKQDMEGLKEVIGSIVELWQGVAPAVQAGAVDMNVVKAMTMTVVRHARMGTEVEDALETGMQEPQQAADPKVAAEQAQAEKEQALAEQQAQHEAQIAQREQQMKEMQAAHDAQVEQAKMAQDAALQREKMDRDEALKRWEVIENNRNKLEIAQVTAGAVIDKAQIDGANAADREVTAGLMDAGQEAQKAETKTKERNAPIDKIAAMHKETQDMHGKTLDAIGKLAEAVAKPRKRVLERGPDGRATGMTESVQ